MATTKTASKGMTHGIHGVMHHAKKEDGVRSPLKAMWLEHESNPPNPKHASKHSPTPEGAASAKHKKGKADANRRKKNKGRS
jgi:hypothetical protein